MSYPALDIARKLISLAVKDQLQYESESLTNMKLQKLMYYVQGYHLAAFGEPLFDEEIESWMYGPVVPSVYDYYSKYKSGPLPEEKSDIAMDEVSDRLFRMVFNFLKSFSALGLMQRTHKESPWLEAEPHNRGTKIPNESIRTYFQTQLLDLLRESISKDIVFFASLPEGWDVYGSPVPSAKAIEWCRTFVSKLDVKSLTNLNIYPNGLGSIDFTITMDRNHRIGLVTGDDCFSWYKKFEHGKRPIGESFVPYTDDKIAEFIKMAEEFWS